MKKLFSKLTAAWPSLGTRQQDPVQFIIHAIKIETQNDLLQIEVLIEPGWFLFTEADYKLDIEPLVISLGHENIPILNDPMHSVDFRSFVLQDILLGNKVYSVYTK
jgi:hypothetical protein